MRHLLLITFCCLQALSALAQHTVIYGRVTDCHSGHEVGQAIVTVQNSQVTVVTNDDGVFSLKTDTMPAAIIVSHIGYASSRIPITPQNATSLHIQLVPTAMTLKELTVRTRDPEELVYEAVRRIPRNYSAVPERYKGFYRETAMKRQHFIYVAESVVDMYKTSYLYGIERDRVAIVKGRRLLSAKASDTLGVKVIGGPVLPIQLDIVKNPEMLFSREELKHYRFRMLEPATINNRLQYVVALMPNAVLPYPLFFGRLYIDREDLSITRAELSLDMSDKKKATDFMLVGKPVGVRFTPKALSFLIDYHHEDSITRLSYLRCTFRFNCDWKRRLFATSFTACSEMVVTDKSSDNATPISGKQSFHTRDAFYDQVDFFHDANFWEDYNIIEPTVTLDRAIDQLLKRQ
ncbi:MAG: carboxypeptidase-like regulatory domain-containing protein [Bacteroidales bacterium]|nr:carboxypeptidase-like regulatory domain-containing protein [Bacteroidales bacterium]